MRKPIFTRLCGEEYNVVISRKPKEYKDFECYAFELISKYNPKAIFRYLNSNRRNDVETTKVRDQARMHLSAIGWSFWSKVKRGHDEWRYDSPSGKTYYSLNTACIAISKGIESNLSDSVCSDVDDDDTLLIDCDENPRNCGIFGKDGDLGDDFCCNAVDDETLLVDCEKVGDLRDSLYYNAVDHGKDSKNCEFVGKDGDLESRKCREKRTRHACSGSVVQEDEDECRVSSDRMDDEYCTVELKSGLVSKKRKKQSARVLRSSKRVRQLGGYSGSKNPRTVLSWLIENNAVVPRSKLYYLKGNSDVPLNEGRISSDGIKCNCCQKLFSLTGFQAHVTGNNICRPAENLFLGNGKSLVSCQVELMRKKIMMFDQGPAVRAAGTGSRSKFRSLARLGSENCNDYVCSICHYGGDLICCDRCPSSFHAACLNIESVPEGDWFCPCCCCGICGDSQSDKMAEQFADDSLLRCHQCERQFHAHCKKDRVMVSGEEHWFCCKTCEMMQWGLQQLLGKPILVGQNLTCTLIKPMQYQAEDREDYDLAAMAENYSKLSVALEVMHECFDPVKDPKTKRDLVEDVIFCRGSNLNRLNFRGFYTVLLERNDELIAVALIRIYGDKVAEMPLIGTRFQHRRLGMCRILVNEIEKTLLNLGVEKLVLPASPSVLNTWTTFGFTPITESDRLDFLGFTFLDFHDTIMCKKLLRKRPTPRTHRSSNMKIILHKPTQNIEGSSINHEGSSSMSGVSQEEERQGSDNVDQGAEANVTSKYLDDEKLEGDKCSLKLKFFRSKNGTVLMPLVPQSNYSKFEGSCRLVSPL
ncbi:increased DNA methylation 1-like [Silene latifolia]|uniref:increased DNA methylation 1-like n=1 Tax=Silene latifolia TaxID=37657 RepID=UPI003D776BE2